MFGYLIVLMPSSSIRQLIHYDNMPMHYTAIIAIYYENVNFQIKRNDSFHIFAPNIDVWYTLELRRF